MSTMPACVGAALLLSVALTALPYAALAELPAHSWDTVPVFYHSCNESGAYSPEALDVVTRFPLVTIEKGQGLHQAPQGQQAEAKILAQLRAVKEHAKANGRQVSTVAYFNSVLDWTMYEMHATMEAHPQWWLRDNHNKTVVRIGGDRSFPQPKGGMLVFDFAQAAVRDFWASACLNMTASGWVDGCFSDRATDDAPAWGAAYAAGHLQMHQDLQAKLGMDTGILVANHAYTMPGVNAVMIESFAADEASIQLLNQSASLGKIVEAHAGYKTDGGDNHCEDVSDALAAFLVAAGNRSYFGCSRGWMVTGPNITSVWHPEYSRPLGAPLGPASVAEVPATDGGGRAGRVYSRSFARGTHVTFDTTKNKGTITWGS